MTPILDINELLDEAPDRNEARMFLVAIQDQTKRREVISILKHAGLIP